MEFKKDGYNRINRNKCGAINCEANEIMDDNITAIKEVKALRVAIKEVKEEI
jgi:hypothetical protein